MKHNVGWAKSDFRIFVGDMLRVALILGLFLYIAKSALS